jgi:pimeloyl-ACP methyl ester carboxylesterase
MLKQQMCFLTPVSRREELPLLIYLPGMDGSGHLLLSQIPGLAKEFDIRCLRIPSNDFSSWKVLSNKVLDLIHTELEKSSCRPVYLCGESFGGCLAIKLAVASPNLFKKIILINPASAFGSRIWLNWASQFTSLVPEFLYQIGSLGLLPFLMSFSRVNRENSRKMLKAMRDVPAATAFWRLSMLKDFHVDKVSLSSLTQPILLIASGNDNLLPSINEARRLKTDLQSSKIAILPDSGHACLLEEGIDLYEILLENEFLPLEKVKI